VFVPGLDYIFVLEQSTVFPMPCGIKAAAQSLTTIAQENLRDRPPLDAEHREASRFSVLDVLELRTPTSPLGVCLFMMT
jgi:hypothetical protein